MQWNKGDRVRSNVSVHDSPFVHGRTGVVSHIDKIDWVVIETDEGLSLRFHPNQLERING